MPEPIRSETREAESPDRTATDRSADRAAIAGSMGELLPALIAKLSATGLAELEVRQDGLRVRLRRPPEGSAAQDRRSTDRSDRTDRGDRIARGAAATSSPAHPVGLSAVGPGRDRREARDGREGREGREPTSRDDNRAVATSPAVGIFQPRSSARAGTRVRAGDRIGTVDMLGVPQDVVAPSDGVVGANLVEPGDAVEYGQGLVVIEFASGSASVPARAMSSSGVASSAVVKDP
ncbi:MAG: acetyl-CoA carboxylase biotin carboxyl carrier protein [Candidatus Limnocylindrales bacterium]